MKGFTLVEIAVTMGIVVIIAGFTTFGIIGIGNVKALDAAAQELAAYLRDAQQKAMTQEQNSQWGVHIDAVNEDKDFYEIFYGVDYATGIKTAKITLSPRVEFIDPAQGATEDVIFSKITGYPDAEHYLILALVRDSSVTRTIHINAKGLISLSDEAPTPGAPPTKVFITSAVYSGNLGGLAGADAKCQAAAVAAGLSGTWKAWLSSGADDVTDARDRLTHNSSAYYNIHGDKVANDWPGLVSGNLLAAIKYNENGNLVSGMAWTGSNYDGAHYLSQDCSGNGTFAAKADYTTGNLPISVAIGDVNGDNKNDLAVVNYSSFSNSVSVFMNNGNGTFGAKTDYTTGTNPRSVAMGDVNGDGKNDLAVANSVSNKVSVFLNNGNGTFSAKADYATDWSPYSVAMGDVNGDGKNDLAVANVGTYNVSIFLNNGNGTFAAQAVYIAGTGPYSVVIGDVNGDGKNDLAVVNNGSATVSVFLNNGNGTFAAKADYTTGSSPISVAIGDVNADGKNDLAVANSFSNSVSVFLNNGNGTFSAKADYTTGSSPSSVAIGDVNADNKNDLAVTSEISNIVSVLLNNGNGTFSAKTDYVTGSGPKSVAIGDVNADNKNDLAVANFSSDTVSVFLNSGGNGWTFSSGAGADAGLAGLVTSTDSSWSNNGSYSCDSSLPLYCFEQ